MALLACRRPFCNIRGAIHEAHALGAGLFGPRLPAMAILRTMFAEHSHCWRPSATVLVVSRSNRLGVAAALHGVLGGGGEARQA